MFAAYLALFNLASAAGWALVVAITFACYRKGASPSAYWAEVAYPLKVVQSMAALEVFHSLFGLVRSPVFTTLMQVSSRLILLWCYTVQSVEDQNHWSLYLMAGRLVLLGVGNECLFDSSLL